jgi:hypothetical protein
MTPVEATLVYCAVPLLSEAEKLVNQGKQLCFGTHARGRRG